MFDIPSVFRIDIVDIQRHSLRLSFPDKIDRIIELYSLILYSLDKEKGAAYFEVHLSLLGWLPISNFKTPPSAISS